MAIVYNDSLEIRAPFHIDRDRGRVQLYSDLQYIQYKYEGLQTWVIADRSCYVYYDNNWHLFYTDTDNIDGVLPPMNVGTDNQILTNDGSNAHWTSDPDELNLDGGYF